MYAQILAHSLVAIDGVCHVQEVIEFRISEKRASQVLLPSIGKKLSDVVRKVDIKSGDPLYVHLGELDRSFREKGEGTLIYSWMPHRRYSVKEIAVAELFQFKITAFFEPDGSQCGTTYDESSVCPSCGAGRRLVGELILDLGKAPKTKDFAQTIAGDEWIVSERLVELLEAHGMTGATFEPVKSAKKRREGSPIWYRLAVSATPVDVAASTRFGIDPFDDDPAGRYRCPEGHVAGLNILSELSVARGSWDGADIVVTRQAVGSRQGVLVPSPLIVISPRLRQLLIEHDIKGFKTEVAYLV